MGIINNALTYGYGFNITAGGPVDSRMRVTHKSDLTTVFGVGKVQEYAGMVVEVCEENALYILKTASFNADGEPIPADVTLEESWTKVGDSAAIAEINDLIAENEFVTAIALTNLDTRVNDAMTTIEENELIVAGTITDLNDRLVELSDKLDELIIDGGEF